MDLREYLESLEKKEIIELYIKLAHNHVELADKLLKEKEKNNK